MHLPGSLTGNTPSIISPKNLGFTLENKRRAKAKNKTNTSFGSPNTKWYTELKTFNNGTVLSSVCKKTEQPYNADFTVDKAQPSYHWCHI